MGSNQLTNIHDLLEQIPVHQINNFLNHKYKGSTLLLVKKRDINEIKKNLQELSNLLSNKLQK